MRFAPFVIASAAFCAVLALNGCGDSGITIDTDDGVSISDGSDASVDSSFSIEADGFSLNIDMPEIDVDSDDTDINGIGLFPKSKITGLNIEDGDVGDGKDRVRLSFRADADADAVADWYAGRFEEENYKVERDGTTLKATSRKDGEITLRVRDSGSGSGSSGTIVFMDEK